MTAIGMKGIVLQGNKAISAEGFWNEFVQVGRPVLVHSVRTALDGSEDPTNQCRANAEAIAELRRRSDR